MATVCDSAEIRNARTVFPVHCYCKKHGNKAINFQQLTIFSGYFVTKIGSLIIFGVKIQIFLFLIENGQWSTLQFQ